MLMVVPCCYVGLAKGSSTVGSVCIGARACDHAEDAVIAVCPPCSDGGRYMPLLQCIPRSSWAIHQVVSGEGWT